ncbi:MAG TPA: 5-oxoprolinase/urea amidolyase family protein [Polyangiaceae bacterium]|jgi:urea carboxylase
MFGKVLVANRGEIACRVLRTLRKMGIASVAVHSEVDAFAKHVREADEAVNIGGARPSESYLRGDRILEVAAQTGAQGIHPGYGFLSERPDFAQACEEAGVRFIGPTAHQIREFGLKHRAREIAHEHGVPLLPGTALLASAAEAVVEAARIGYPVILKSTAGGGGIGLRMCRDEAELAASFASVERLGRANFGESGMYLERFVERARHIEVQIFGDGRGGVVALGERDCSVQRRNQKVVEETPAPGLAEGTRAKLFEAALRLGRAVRYRSAGTVEFVVDAATQEFFFLEVNTRLQVEHGVTESVTGVDLVEWMILEATSSLKLESLPTVPRGAAIEVRVYAEDPAKGHQPSTGRVTDVFFDPAVRVDGWVEAGTEVSPYYDPLLAKVIARGETREAALEVLARALASARIAGVETNLAYLRQVIDAPDFRSGRATTRLLTELAYQSTSIDVVEGGAQTTVQDMPGRLGLWSVGVPPSGPMDDRAFALANRAVGNAEGAPALEATVIGPTLKFRSATVFALAGARMKATLDGAPVPYFEPVRAGPGSELRIGHVEGRGCRTYVAVRGGVAVPEYLGARATFMLGRFGGHGGRAIRAGDVLAIGGAAEGTGNGVGASPLPAYPEVWEIGVLDGPHGAPDFFTPEDIEAIYAATWKVHYNSDRTGVRLIGPKPTWARRDGGEAGLHPSNIHDNAYAIGTVDYTGDMPVILGPDGPSLGGFVCPVTIARSERWKMGQLKAGDAVRFVRIAGRALVEVGGNPTSAVVAKLSSSEVGEDVVYRRDGDECLLVEYGAPALDIGLRLRAHALMEALERRREPGIVDLTPGIRSLHVHHDPTVLPARKLLALLRSLERDLPRLDEIEIPTRVVHLPLSWEDPATLLAIEKYMRSVRADAPWCPSNIEFIRRINGLQSVDDVKRVVFDARYLVLGLGDVYLGAPVATPVDPRHRLVTTKYNPARTWTPENAVGIGGAYLCVYGMEGPGGYQFVGRTLQMWNTYGTASPRDFRDGKPYLLRFFDELRFESVGADELLEMRRAFPYGKAHVKIEESTFCFSRYRAWLAENATSIGSFKKVQQAAFEAERERWRISGIGAVSDAVVEEATGIPEDDAAIPEGCAAVTSPVAGSVWQIAADVGTVVAPGKPVVVVEAMKTEIAVVATSGGVVERVLVAPGKSVVPGQVVAVIRLGG